MIEKIIVVLLVVLLYGVYVTRIDDAIDKIMQNMRERQAATGCTTPEYRRPTMPPDCIDVEQLHAGLQLIIEPPAPVTCGVCRHRDKQEPRLCNHSLGIDVAINPWDSCEHGEREVEA